MTDSPRTPDATGAPSPEAGLLSLRDVDEKTLSELVRRSVDFHRDQRLATRPLEGRAVGILFTATSTRTRTAFTVAALRLGGTPVAYGPADLQLATGESLADTGRILGLMLDALVVRTAGPLAEMRQLARAAGRPVINAMATEEHPTQAVCDIATLVRHFGSLSGLSFLYVGEGNNTATALARGMARVPGLRVTFATPPGYGLPSALLAEAAAEAGRRGTVIEEVHDMGRLPGHVDAVYTTRWQTTGTSKVDPAWRERFRPFYVDETLMSRFPGAVFMHDLPAHRGDEVSGAVLDGEGSLAWRQAAMKLASAMAVLEYAVAGDS
ncbi:ornithine carbamoyltransferase [Streptomyces tailanensis]|uniref:ornithine carbamoyltransferase n=1 Tax=Streptomyces tailanensis TaxID=2569858 RepID=UPI00122E5AF7|nr:ornithine carbamoyltransferase [Streptomyces tailanensis]